MNFRLWAAASGLLLPLIAFIWVVRRLAPGNEFAATFVLMAGGAIAIALLYLRICRKARKAEKRVSAQMSAALRKASL